MYVTRAPRVIITKHTAAQLSKAVASYTQCNGVNTNTTGLRLSSLQIHAQPTSRRHFSTTPQTRLRDVFPEPDSPKILKTEPAWPHPSFTEDQMTKNIFFAHRQPKDFSDRVALGLVRLLRKITDFATRYKHDVEVPATASTPNAVQKTQSYGMSESKWLTRFIFLESIAGVPGMIAGMLRHLHSLRRLQRDNGWIETLLEEAYNERMHLLTFLKMSEPGWFMRVMILGAQGVFFNSMFFAYLLSPKTCHRFVGYIEEEAVLTYTLAIKDVEDGKLPKWTDPNFKIPDLAVEYWQMPEGKRTMRDLLLYIRADEAKHREVNHTLGNLNQVGDPNPFVSEYKGNGDGNGNEKKLRPTKGIENTGVRPVGWERDEVI